MRELEKLNKYERAYLKKLQKIRKKRFFQNQRPSIGKKIIYNFYYLKNKISFSLKEYSIKRKESRKNQINKKNDFLNNFDGIDNNLVKSVNTTNSINQIIPMKTQKIKRKDTVSDISKKTKVIKKIKRTPKNKTTFKKNKKKNSFRVFKNTFLKIFKKRKEKKEKKRKKKKGKNNLFKILKWFIGFGLILVLISFAILFAWFSSLEIPNVDNFDQRKISNSTKLYDKTGEILLYDIHENIQRTVVESDKIAQSTKDAIVSIEDHNFYEHNGVVWKSTIRGILQTLLFKIGLTNAGTSGGSTLTQQMVKNTLLTREKTITRKMKEWVLAYKIEDKLSKDEILTVYLNEAPYGGTIYGVQEASRIFFGKSASDVTIAESAYLASIPNLPTFYSPYGKNKAQLDKRQKIVLSEMKKYGYISDSQYRKAISENVEFLPLENNYAKALHFVQYVREILEKKYGADRVENGGLKVITTLDYKLQQKAEKIIKNHIEEVGKKYDASNAALVAIESQTGNIITMVGSKDYFDTENFDGNFNVATSPRQPGSSFKPFAYATAFDKGYLPESIIFDTETQFNSNCKPEDTTSNNGCYSPNNYDFKFKGVLSFRDALAQSRNIPAIKILHLAGLSEVIERTREMGITSLTKKPSYYGLGLVLGGGEVSLLEMVSAYTTFPNDGEYNKINAILEITDANGNIIEKYQKNEMRVFSRNAARMVSSVLSDNVARTPLFGPQSFLYFGGKSVAGKTGTTNDKRDAWLIGYTSDVAVGVWTGNNDNSSMKKGSSISGKPWRKFMDEIISTYKSKKFKEYTLPENFDILPPMIRGDWNGGETYIIDSVSEKLATEFTPDEFKVSVTKFDPHTILHSINKNNPQKEGNSQDDPQYSNWEYGVQNYSHIYYVDKYNQNTKPVEYDDVHNEDGLLQEADFDFEIDNLKSRYSMDDTIKVEIDIHDISNNEIKSVLYYVNNSFTGSVQNVPFDFNFTPQDIQYLGSENTLRVVVVNNDDKKVSREDSFRVRLPEGANDYSVNSEGDTKKKITVEEFLNRRKNRNSNL